MSVSERPRDYRYSFGCAAVSSEVRLSGLSAGDAGVPAFVSLRRAPIDRLDRDWTEAPVSPRDRTPVWLAVARFAATTGDWLRVRYEYRGHFADFAIRADGREILVEASDTAEDEQLAHLLEGAILGQAMRLAGAPLIHGSAVSADGRAVMLIGGSGAGKSSLSWALVQQGCHLVSDDLAACAISDDSVMVHPVRTRLRLWPDSAAGLSVKGDVASLLFPTAPEMGKLGLLDPAVLAPAMPLHAIYQLRRSRTAGAVPGFEAMSPTAAIAQLGANLYGHVAPARAARKLELATLSALASRVPVRLLTLPHGLDALPEMAALLRHSLFA